mmetsp:Transcript_3252/g.9937  ORF Transcript_3252/g.9937 Transcript_3252/m.9937 type:complete len:230 (-) Transcript_3252:401-1090(-)
MVRLLLEGQLEVLRRGHDIAALEVEHQTFNLLVPNWQLRDQSLGLIFLAVGLAEVSPPQHRAPHHGTAIGEDTRDDDLHHIGDAVTHPVAHVPDQGQLLPAVPRTRQMSGRELAVVAILLHQAPLCSILVEGHRERRRTLIEQRFLMLLRGIIEEESDGPRLQGRPSIHEELAGLGDQPSGHPILCTQNPESPQPAGTPQGRREVGRALLGVARLHIIGDLKCSVGARR